MRNARAMRAISLTSGDLPNSQERGACGIIEFDPRARAINRGKACTFAGHFHFEVVFIVEIIAEEFADGRSIP